jgi:putative transposase
MKSSNAAIACGFSRSAYYYRGTGNKPGKRPTSVTVTVEGGTACDAEVVKDIKDIIAPEFIDYGYDKVAKLLQETYRINRKKVYRLMKEHRLLNGKKRPDGALKDYVRFAQPCPGQPYEVLEIDIKYVRVQGDGKNAYLITVLDVFTRRALVWDLAFSMKAERVKTLFERLVLEHLQPMELLSRGVCVTLRSDNGSQFVAKEVRAVLAANGIFHEFTKPATPEQNGYIESFHSTVERLVCGKFEFDSLAEAKEVFERFYDAYNNRRILKCLGYKSPVGFFQCWESGSVAVAYGIKRRNQIFFFRSKQAA